MSNSPRKEAEDGLNESWVELHYSEQHFNGSSPSSAYNGNMEKMLLEAQRESRSTSPAQGGGSARSQNSPGSSVIGSGAGSSNGTGSSPSATSAESSQGLPRALMEAAGRGTEWIWEWASRPEPHPPKEFKFQHPNKTKLSMRKSKAMKNEGFSLFVVIPALILSHLACIGIGVCVGMHAAQRPATS